MTRDFRSDQTADEDCDGRSQPKPGRRAQHNLDRGMEMRDERSGSNLTRITPFSRGDHQECSDRQAMTRRSLSLTGSRFLLHDEEADPEKCEDNDCYQSYDDVRQKTQN